MVVQCFVLHVVYVVFCFSVVVRFLVQSECSVSPVCCVFQCCGQIPFLCGVWILLCVVSLCCDCISSVLFQWCIVYFSVVSDSALVWFLLNALCIDVVTIFQVLCLTCMLCISVLWSDSFHKLFLYCVGVWAVFQVLCISVLWSDSFHMLFLYYACVAAVFQVLCISVLWSDSSPSGCRICRGITQIICPPTSYL